jgi:hypothetical protein
VTKIGGALLGIALGVGGCGGGAGGVALVGSDAAGVAPDTGSTVADAGPALDAGGADAAVANGGVAATWTVIYTQMFANPSYPSNCTGSACHDPGREHGIDFSTQATGYASIHARVTPGAPETSSLMITLTTGFMPQGRPRLPAADVDRISAWIRAGANND